MKLSYTSIRFIKIHNAKLALLNYFLMLATLTYVIVVQIYFQEAYQDYSPLVGSLSIKIKGASQDHDGRIYDTHDLVIPPMEDDAFFVTTAFFKTKQTRGHCLSDRKCTTPSDCEEKEDYKQYTEHGRLTNKCTAKFCEIEGWCPIEDDDRSATLVNNYTGLWTVFVKANIHFPKHHERTSNAVEKIEPGVNLFTINDILNKADTKYTDVQSSGAIILCDVRFDCDLNNGIDQCKPNFKFERIDLRGFSTGFNYRRTTELGDNSRLLSKIYGTRVIFSLQGKGGKFSMSQLTIALGAGLGLLAVSKVISDFVMEHVLPEKEHYMDRKYTEVKDPYVWVSALEAKDDTGVPDADSMIQA